MANNNEVLHQQKATELALTFFQQMKEALTSAFHLNELYQTARTNSQWSQELLEEFNEKNAALLLALQNRHSDILTNDRKTYYETEGLEDRRRWYIFWLCLYFPSALFYLIFSATGIAATNKFVWGFKLLLKAVGLLYLPFLVPWAIRLLSKWMGRISKQLPKNVYVSL